MFGEWTETDCHTQLSNMSRVGNEAKETPQKTSGLLNGTETGHEG